MDIDFMCNRRWKNNKALMLETLRFHKLYKKKLKRDHI